MKSFFRRYGGKFYLRNKILPLFPKHIDDYIEPLVGAGSIFLHLEKFGIKVKTTCYINDLDDEIFNLWYCFFNEEHYKKLMKLLEDFAIYGESFFKFLRSSLFEKPEEKAFRFMMLTFSSFQGQAKSYYVGINQEGRKNNKVYKPELYWRQFHNYLVRMNTKVSNRDYSKLLTGSFNRKNSFAYVDPPYLDSVGYGELNFTKKEHLNLFNLLSSFKGKFALSINNHEWILEKYSNFNINVLKTRYCSNAHSDKNKKRSVKELLITNYTLDENGDAI